MALSASRLVCSAIEVITWTTSPISAEDEPSRDISFSVRCATATAFPATCAATVALRRGDLVDRRAHLLGAGSYPTAGLRHQLGGRDGSIDLVTDRTVSSARVRLMQLSSVDRPASS